MTEELRFFIFLLEQYAYTTHTTADRILKKWDSLGVTDLIYEMYWQYHSESIENAYADIDAICAEAEQRRNV